MNKMLRNLFVLVVALALCSLAAGAHADTLIPAHGKYSAAYQGDWSNLPTGDKLARHDLSRYPLKEVTGEIARKVFRDQAKVTLSGERLRVHWQNPQCDKYGNALYYFLNCEEVVIDDMVIAQADPDYRASSVFLFEDCGSITIRDSYLGGSSGKALIRIEGCGRYFIDRLEIAGREYPGVGVRSGPGIFINNGIGWDAARNHPADLYSPHPRELQWGVIQNSYIHDYPNVVPNTNHDGILFHAPADGLVFNCVFENYEADSCLDISHRRNDPGYQNHLFRLERNIFKRCHRVKTNGATGSPSCAILWANNLYVDSMLTDYHTGWKNWHVHETFRFTRPTGYFCTIECRPGGAFFRNCLLSSAAPLTSLYEPWGKAGEDVRVLQPDYCLYLMPVPGGWLRPRGNAIAPIKDWQAWQAAGFDTHSQLRQADPRFVNAEQGDYRLLPSSPAVGFGTPATLQPEGIRPGVTWDFYKQPRPNPPSAGAFEKSPAP